MGLYEFKGGESLVYHTGEKPGKGKYRCIHCSEIINLDPDSDTLPPCPKCYKTNWEKV